MQQKTDRVHVENLLLTAVTHFSGGVNKFPGGARPYALCNTESLINEFTNKYIWFYNIFNAREAWNKGQLLKGRVVEKRLRTALAQPNRTQK